MVTFSRNNVLASDYIWVAFMCLCGWVIAFHCHLCARQPESNALPLPLLTSPCAPHAHFAGLCTHVCIHTGAYTHVTKEKRPSLQKINTTVCLCFEYYDCVLCTMLLIYWQKHLTQVWKTFPCNSLPDKIQVAQLNLNFR